MIKKVLLSFVLQILQAPLILFLIAMILPKKTPWVYNMKLI